MSPSVIEAKRGGGSSGSSYTGNGPATAASARSANSNNEGNGLSTKDDDFIQNAFVIFIGFLIVGGWRLVPWFMERHWAKNR